MATPQPGQGLPANTTEVLAATIASAVERQLTQYVSAMAQQVDATRQSVDATRDDLRSEFHAAHLNLQAAIEARLAEFAEHQSARLKAIESTLMDGGGGVGGGSVDTGELIALREHIDAQSAAAHARIDDLQRSARRFDEQTSALVQHVNDTTIALSQRMDDGNQALASALEERLSLVRSTLEAVGPEVQRQIGEHAQLLTQRFDFTEHKITDRMLAMEERVNEQNGTKIAKLEATLGRIGSGFDDAMGALSQRMLELENRVAEAVLQVNILGEKVNTVDEEAINKVKDQLSSAVGEVMLVRIELDRVVANTDEKVDKANLRMAEIEALLTDQMDVSAAVQLERLDELERAVAMLDPAHRGAGAATAVPGLSAVPPRPPIPSTSLGSTIPPAASSEQSLSSF
ncbi:MAG TPA: hypothetical protein PLV13_00510 [Ilumatobacteraceae bacterium]|nr:hypothetical protein [Ilumatobacteraceae bacterium]